MRAGRSSVRSVHRLVAERSLWRTMGEFATPIHLMKTARSVAMSGSINRCKTPAEPEWHERENAPFANPASFSCQSSEFRLPRSVEDISVEWIETGDVEVARICLFNRFFAKLVDGAKPGWS